MAPPFAWLLVCAAHTAGVSQGTVVVGRDADANDAVTVDVELVFARGDAALLGESPVVVRAGPAVCPGTVVVEDVEEDGRALRLGARCPGGSVGDGVELDVGGLQKLPETHRLLLKILDDGGDRATMLWAQGTTATLSVRHPHAPGWPLALVAAALLLTVIGARRPLGALGATAALAGAGAGLTAFLQPPGAPGTIPVVGAVAVAVLSLLVSPAPRLRLVALPLGALLWWLLAPLLA
jgi:hypothetical protein